MFCFGKARPSVQMYELLSGPFEIISQYYIILPVFEVYDSQYSNNNYQTVYIAIITQKYITL